MTIHLGKRRPGSLTAASPGDTLYIPLAFYNDSGASISIGSSLAVGDIEVFKDGSVTQRATDSGYAVLGDTGNFDNRIGFKGISISLFNTADDASFYAAGSTYWVAIDGVTVDARTVRFWPAMFEIDGVPADTGAVSRAVWDSLTASHATNSTFGRFVGVELDTGVRSWVASDTGLRAILALADTGKIATAVWAGDTGLRDLISDVKVELDTGLRSLINVHDTGVHSDLHAIQAKLAEVDTGLRDTLADYDTGLRDLLNDRFSELDTGGVNIRKIFGDTGAAAHLKQFTDKLDATGQIDTGTGSSTSKIVVSATATLDTGAINNAIWNGVVSDHATDGTFGVKFDDIDTGIRTAISGIAAGSTDTGLVNNAVWNGVRADHTTDGTFGIAFSDIDTGIRTAISQISATVDTGVVNQAVWQGNASRTLTALDVDTGLRDLVSDLKNELDTGLRAILALADTGKIATAVWAGDTGLRDLVTDLKTELDTGLRDTLADYDTGIRALLALRDTGAIATAVWAGDTGLRDHITNVDTGITQRLDVIRFDVDTGLRSHISDVDTGIHDTIADLDTGLRGILVTTGVNLGLIRGDTGAADRLLKLAGSQLKTDGTFDTGTGQTTNTFNITATATVDTGLIVNGVWNAQTSAHTTDGTYGVLIQDIDTGIRTAISGIAAGSTDTGLVSNAVWNSLRADHVGAASFGADVPSDTGIRDTLADYDTGIRALLALRDTGAIATAVWAGDTGLRDHITNVDTGITQRLDVIRFDVDTGLRTHISDVDTGLHDTIADLDTGLRGILQTTGVNVTRIIGDTGSADQLQKAFATTPTYFQQVDVQLVDADTGAATHLKQLVADGFNDTGLNDRLARIQSDVDTGLRDKINEVDTGVHKAITDMDTGIRDRLDELDTGMRTWVASDTGLRAILALADTGKIATAVWAGDTGIRAMLALADTGKIATAVWAGDTGLRDHITNVDTGLTNRLNIIASDADTGLRSRISGILSADTFAEPSGVPSATVDLATKIGYVYMALRNRIDVTASAKTFYDDAGGAEWKKTLSDDGATYTEAEGSAP